MWKLHVQKMQGIVVSILKNMINLSGSSVPQEHPVMAAQCWSIWSWWIIQRPSCQKTPWRTWPHSGPSLSDTDTSEKASSVASSPGWVLSTSWKHSASLVSWSGFPYLSSVMVLFFSWRGKTVNCLLYFQFPELTAKDSGFFPMSFRLYSLLLRW